MGGTTFILESVMEFKCRYKEPGSKIAMSRPASVLSNLFCVAVVYSVIHVYFVMCIFILFIPIIFVIIANILISKCLIGVCMTLDICRFNWGLYDSRYM